MSGDLVRVLVVDDDPATRRLLREILAEDGGLELVGEAADGRAALEVIRSTRVDVVLLDVRMPRLDGIATLEVMRREAHPVHVVILTTFGDAEYVRSAISLGAEGFLLKAGDPRELLRAIHGTAAGEAWLSPAVARIVTEELRGNLAQDSERAEAERRLAVLTPREREVADLIAEGASNAEIAAELVLSQSTIKAYVSSAIERLGARNRVDVANAVWRTRPGSES